LSFLIIRNAFLGIIPGSVNPVSTRKKIVRNEQTVTAKGIRGETFFHNYGARII
jgi:hypothetical protein